jgi:hypothetical protein
LAQADFKPISARNISLRHVMAKSISIAKQSAAISARRAAKRRRLLLDQYPDFELGV